MDTKAQQRFECTSSATRVSNPAARRSFRSLSPNSSRPEAPSRSIEFAGTNWSLYHKVHKMAGAPGNYSARLNKIPPDKGSFPLDHENQCKLQMIEYLKCLKNNKSDNEKCRDLSKKYLECRMDHNLMAREDWSKLGFQDKDN